MIKIDGKFDYATATWSLTGKVKSTASRLKSRGYTLDSKHLSWQAVWWTNAPKVAPRILSTWGK